MDHPRLGVIHLPCMYGMFMQGIHIVYCRTIRQCNSDCTIGGVDVKKGLQVFVMITAVHKDPEVYPDPERFIPER